MKRDNYIRITLRIPEKLHASLTKAAENTRKSMNTEIIDRLDQTFTSSKALRKVASDLLPQPDQTEILEKIEALTMEIREIRRQLRQQARSF